MNTILGNSTKAISTGLAIAAVAFALTACGKQETLPDGTVVPTTNVSLQSHALAGPGSAATRRPGLNLATLLSMPGKALELLLGVNTAHAVVSSFATFSACNDTLILLDTNGNQVTVNSSTTPSVGQGLLTFSSSATNPMTIGSLSIPVGLVLSEIDITFAVKPSVCGVNYAVRFDDGVNGVIDITQNTAFKFRFPAGGTQITGAAQTVDLKFGAIVDGMVGLGAGLDNSTIQTVNVGQAQ